MVQMAYQAGELAFFASAIVVLALITWTAWNAVSRRPLRMPLGALTVAIVLYAVTLVVGNAGSRDRHVRLGTALCFDEWCASVTRVRAVPSARSTQKVVIATLRISSAARRKTQRGSNPQVYFIDTAANWYPAEHIACACPNLRAPVAPASAFVTQVSGTLPAAATVAFVRVWEGAWIDHIVLFDEESPFHGKTYFVVDGRRAKVGETTVETHQT